MSYLRQLAEGGTRVLWCTARFPACRHADGTISSSTVMDVRRMASEDSEKLEPGLLAIHRLGDLHDPDEPVFRQMLAGIDQLKTLRKLREVLALGRVQRVCLKEWNDHVDQIRPSPHNVAIQVLSVLVVTPVGNHLSHTEELLQFV